MFAAVPSSAVLLMGFDTDIAIIRGKKYPFMRGFSFHIYFFKECFGIERDQHQQNGFSFSLFRFRLIQ